MNQEILSTEDLAKTSANTGAFYTAPKVIFLVGRSVRRFHTMCILAQMLDEMQLSFTFMSTSIKAHDLEAMQERLPFTSGSIIPYGFKKFKEIYASYQIPSPKQSLIVIEMDFAFLAKISFAEHEVQTLLLTDFAFEDPDFPEMLEERIIAQMKRASLLQTIVYNYDIEEDSRGQSKNYYLPIDDIPIRTHSSFGRTTDSMMQFTLTDIALTINMPNLRMDVPYDSHMTSIKREGYFAAVGLLLSERIITTTSKYVHMPLSPWFEDTPSPLSTIVWMQFATLPEEMNAIISAHPYLCVSISVYLRFEQVIENRIIDLERLIVVAEKPEQEALFSEYFVQKEKDSYHTIVYIPEKDVLQEALPKITEGKPICYVFDELGSVKSFLK